MEREQSIQYQRYSDEEKRRIKRRRAVRSAMAVVTATAGAMFLTGGLQLPDLGALNQLPLNRAAGGVMLVVSLWLGWRPGYETWFGDQRLYVDEPDVEDEQGER